MFNKKTKEQKNRRTKEQKGISLYLVIVILAILLGISLGLSSLLIIQIRIIRGMEESVIAFFAADTGIERMIYEPVSDFSESLPNGSFYIAQIRCNPGYTPCPYPVDPECDAPRFCIKSRGAFREARRAIEVKY